MRKKTHPISKNRERNYKNVINTDITKTNTREKIQPIHFLTLFCASPRAKFNAANDHQAEGSPKLMNIVEFSAYHDVHNIVKKQKRMYKKTLHGRI